MIRRQIAKRAARRKTPARAQKTWVTNGFSLNAKLRGDHQLLEEMPLDRGVDADSLTAELDSAMKPLRRRRQLYRGISNPEQVFRQEGSLEGHEFTDPGFVSTSSDPGMAEDFGSGATLRINAAPGTPSLDLEDLNNQREVVLGRGLRHRVTRDEVVDGRRMLDVEVARTSASPRSRRSRRFPLWIAIMAAVVLVLLAAIVGTVMAILGANLSCMGGGSAIAAPATKTAVREIPPERLRIYQEAGRRFDVNWAFLASVGYQECGHGACAKVYPSGCAGPMAIAYVRGSACSPDPSAPTIWERYGVDGDGDGDTDVLDPVDAIFTAARMLRPVFGLAGDSFAAYRQVACNYYGACGDSLASYADEVMARAVEYGFRGKGAPAPTGAGETEMVAAGGGGSGSSCGGGSSSGSASGNEIVRIAQSQLGTVESPPGTNCNPYGPCVEWCSLFVSWVWKRAGVPLEGGTATYAYSGTVYKWAQAHEGGPFAVTAPGDPPLSTAENNGARVLPPTATPAPGDAVLYGTGPEFGESDHIGIVERVFPNGEITTIDGNLGDRVARAGPFLPSQATAAGMPAPIFGFAHPPIAESEAG